MPLRVCKASNINYDNASASIAIPMHLVYIITNEREVLNKELLRSLEVLF